MGSRHEMRQGMSWHDSLNVGVETSAMRWKNKILQHKCENVCECVQMPNVQCQLEMVGHCDDWRRETSRQEGG